MEMIKINEEQKREKREKMIARENDIAKNLEKLESWKKDIQNRREKRETVNLSIWSTKLFSTTFHLLGCASC